MKNTGTSLILAIVLLAAGAPAAPASCCAPKRGMDRTMRAADCCDSMVDCPEAPEAGSAALVSVERAAAPAIVFSAGVLPDSNRVAAAPASAAAVVHKPPFYRLHAQLLI